MRIGLLADAVEVPGGIGRYVRELLFALGRRDDVRLVVAAPPSAKHRVASLAGDALDGQVPIPVGGQLAVALWVRHASGRRFLRSGVDVVHGTKHLLPRTRLPTVLTVHDVLTITRARENGLAKRLLLPHQYRSALTRATRLVAVSQTTQTRLGELDPVWAAKAVVVPNGVSHHLLESASEPVPELADRSFALVVGDLAPRKNLPLLLDIWTEVARSSGLVLAVVGHPGPHSHQTRQRLEALARQGLASWIPSADDRCLRWCYEHATVVLLPTLEEGFGLPLLEALAFGAPVLASTEPALVEVASGSGRVRHLDPRDGASWRDAIVAAAGSPRPVADPAFIPPGTPTWDAHAEGVVRVYREVLAASGS